MCAFSAEAVLLSSFRMKPVIPLILAAAWLSPLHAAETLPAGPAGQAAQAVPAVVRSEAQLNQALASGRPTPLDALTPYGRHRLLHSIAWGQRGMMGFSTAPLQRELDVTQLDAILRFLDLTEYRAALAGGMNGPPLRLPQPSMEVVRRLESLEDFNDKIRRRRMDAASTTLGTPEVLQRYRKGFAERMGPQALARQPLGDLLPLFDAANLAAFDNPGSAALDQLLLVHADLNARGVDTRRVLDKSVLEAMLAARRFEQARGFAATRPHLDAGAVPHVADPLAPGFRGRSVFAYDAARNTLTRQAVPPPPGAELVMVVGAGCHFSRDALDAIGNDPALQKRLRDAKLLLLTPPTEAPSLRFVADWNAGHAALPMRIPFEAREWQGIDMPGVPAFYLLKEGKVVARHRGWAGEEDRAALLKLLDAAGR